MKKALCFFLLTHILWPNWSWGQEAALPVRVYKGEDGLSQNTVFCMVQDHRGFMWFGTEDGLNRFDGQSFHTYLPNSDSSGSIADRAIIAAFCDADGQLFFATRNGQIARYHAYTDRFEHIPLHPETERELDHIHAMTSDQAGEVLMGGHLGQIYRLRSKGDSTWVESLQQIGEWPKTEILSLFKDGKTLWIGTTQGLLHATLDGAAIRLREMAMPLNAPTKVQAIQEDPAGNIWFGGTGPRASLIRWNPLQQRFRTDLALRGQDIGALLPMSDGSIWVGLKSNAGLLRLVPEDNMYQVQMFPNRLSAASVLCMIQDREQGMWIGTYGQGINVISPQAAFVGEFFPQRAVSVRSIHQFPDGEVWMGTYLGLRRWRKTNEISAPLANTEWASVVFTAFLPDTIAGKKVVWMATEDKGLLRYNGEKLQKIALPYGEANQLRCLAKSQRGKLLIGSSQGLIVYNPQTDESQLFSPEMEHPSPDRNRIECIQALTGGRWLMGSFGNGLFVWDEAQQTFERLQLRGESNGLPDRIKCIHHDSLRQEYWIGTAGSGILVLKHDSSGSFQEGGSWRQKDGLSNDVVYGILSDAQGRKWCSTNQGISYILPERNQVGHLGLMDGLQDTEFNANAWYAGRDGKLFFGGIRGLNIIDTRQIPTRKVPDRLILRSVRSYKQAMPMDSSLWTQSYFAMDAVDQPIHFSFSPIQYHVAIPTQYQYRLIGMDERWIDLGTRRTISFTNLDPGTYRLQISAKSMTPSAEGLAVWLVIQAPIWGQRWFQALLIILALMAVFAVIAVRTRTLYRQRTYLQQQIDLRTRELQEQKNALQEANSKIRLINESLENAIVERTSELMASQDQMSVFVDNLPGVSYRAKDNERLTWILLSQGTKSILGREAENMMAQQQGLIDHVQPTHHAALHLAIDAARSRKEPIGIELPVVLDGQIRWVLNRFTFTQTDQEDHIDGLLLDITQAKAAQEAVRKSEQRFQLAIEGAREGLWDWDLPRDRYFINNILPDILGYSHNEFYEIFHDPQRQRSLFHPDAREEMRQRIINCLKGRQEVETMEYQMLHKDKGWRWMQGRISVVERDPNGRALRMIGTMLDIEQQKATLRSLEENRHMLSTIFNNTRDFILLMDVEGPNQYRLSSCNPAMMTAFQQLNGAIRQEDLVGRDVRDLLHKNSAAYELDWQGILTHCQSVCASGEPETFILQIQLESGQGFSIDVHTIPILDANGDCHQILQVSRDIRSLKATENEIISAVIDNTDRERRRIAREIHDSLGQKLTTISLTLKSIRKEMEVLPPEAEQVYHSGLELLRQSIKESRMLAHTLMPKAIDDFGYVPAVESLIEQVALVGTTRFSFFNNLSGKRLSPKTERHLYRITQEAINNILKHAGAAKATVQLMAYEDSIVLTIEDDGKGFDSKNDSSVVSFGLNSIRTRAQALDGSLHVDSRPGKGTSILIQIPNQPLA
ncbi:MAG: two-component regulator propeller domain-containing protein [Bacteroidota bacterium]